MALANAYSNAVFENEKILNIRHIYEAIKNSKSIYEDAKRKGIIEFKEQFKEILDAENVKLD